MRRMVPVVVLVACLVSAACAAPPLNPVPSLPCTGAPGNSFVSGTLPADLREGNLEDDACTPLYEEATITLPAPLSVRNPAAASLADGALIDLPAGSVVTSYLLHADKVGESTDVVRFEGEWTAPCDVIGALATDRDLARSQALFANPQIVYPTSWSGHGFENSTFPSPDVVDVDADGRTVRWSIDTTTAMDHVRLLCGTLVPPPVCEGTPGNSHVVGTEPADLSEGRLEDDGCTPLFEEATVTLAAPLSVRDPNASSMVDGALVTLPAGSVVTSYLLHADKVGASTEVVTFGGRWTAPCDIVGALATEGDLSRSQSLFSDPQLAYPASWSDYGFENSSFSNPDVVFVEEDRRTVHWSIDTTTAMDHVRLLCGTVAPASVLSGVVRVDQFADRLRDPDAAVVSQPLAGWQVTAFVDSDSDGVVDAGEVAAGTATTNSAGSFSFSLTPDRYVVCETVPVVVGGHGPWQQSFPLNARCGAVPGAGSGGHAVNLVSAATVEFDNFQDAGIGGFVAFDRDRDGVQDPMTAPYACPSGVTVTVYDDRDGDDEVDPSDPVAFTAGPTNPSGCGQNGFSFYVFDVPGRYVACATTSQSYVQVAPTSGPSLSAWRANACAGVSSFSGGLDRSTTSGGGGNSYWFLFDDA